ncbi:Uncharacterised protein [Yersinia pseudotuberculosis]|uniref:Uncharacterized protein n=1 Tax=Yersinia pseudotuberculosis TaxID=633 RepID=A0A380Q3H6_YERPU|nr:Uncharacterised protein [Yersinia pseudotuberculosis]
MKNRYQYLNKDIRLKYKKTLTIRSGCFVVPCYRLFLDIVTAEFAAYGAVAQQPPITVDHQR